MQNNTLWLDLFAVFVLLVMLVAFTGGFHKYVTRGDNDHKEEDS